MDFELPIYPENQAAMKKYMQSQFEFNGVKAPDRHLIERELWQSVKQLPPAEIMLFIETLYARPTREYQYVPSRWHCVQYVGGNRLIWNIY